MNSAGFISFFVRFTVPPNTRPASIAGKSPKKPELCLDAVLHEAHEILHEALQ